MKTKQVKYVLCLLAVLGCVFLLDTVCQAAAFTVDDSGGADFTTIGDAMAAVSSGDTIQVLPEVYQSSAV